jgi:Bacterial PH domain
MADGVHRTYRSLSLRGIGGVGFVLAVVLSVWVLTDEVGRRHWLVAIAAGLWGVVLAVLIVEVFLRPSVATTPEGVVLVNPFRTVVVPWAAVRGVETELALQILTDDGKHTSWAATGSRSSSLRARGLRGQRGALAFSSRSPSMTELLKAQASADGITPPVECRLFIELGLQEWRVRTARAPVPPAEESPPPRLAWHRGFLVALAVPAVLLLAATIAIR